MRVEQTTSLGGLLRTLRERALLTQEELSARSGVSVGTIAGLEAGRTRRPRSVSVRLLADGLGLSPEDRAALVAAARHEPAPAVPVPAQLPADLPDFTGRADCLVWLDTAGTPVVVLSGPPGVGKTGLAIHWGHQIWRDRFPDGQLYVDLRGYSPSAPLAPVEVLAGFLPALGVPGPSVPVGVDQAAATYRSLLAGRRMLVVLDNAAEVEQVRPLLPGTASCMVVVTSRDRLTGLVAATGARWLGLDVLPAPDAYTLLSRTLGEQRVAAEPAAVAELAELCGYLPLALRVAAANLATRPQQSVGGLVAQLRDRNRLDVLTVDGDPHRTVAGAFELSYRRLPGPARRMFRLLGLVPARDVTAPAAAALAGVTTAEAAFQLGVLARAHLLDEPVAGRYTGHDLLRRYAADRAADEEPDAVRQRLLSWYAYGAETAAAILYPDMLRLPPAVPAAATGPPPVELAGPAQALAWLKAEYANLVAAIRPAAEPGPGPWAWRLAHSLRGYWWRTGQLVDWLAAATAAETAAAGDDDPIGRAAAQLCLGAVHHRLGDQLRAGEHYTAAAELAHQAGWLQGQSSARGNRALTHWLAGRLDLAAADLAEALALDRRSGWRAQQAVTANNLGMIYHELGRLAEARDSYRQSLALHRELDTAGGTDTSPLNNLGLVARDLGHLDQAREHLSRALARCRELGDRTDEARVLDTLAIVELDAGRYAEAQAAAEACRRLADQMADGSLQACARIRLGNVHQHLGQPRRALDGHRRALELARQSGDRTVELDALLGAAVAHRDLGHRDQAGAHLSQALDLARNHGYRLREGRALTIAAEIHLSQDDHQPAGRYAQRALDRHRQTGLRLFEARTLLVLGQLAQRAGDCGTARDHWRRADALFAEIGAPGPLAR
jgi:tetratricopeptide (TPR) repeat protein/transcriptional regulator with XRE-family HTH domain